MQRNVRLAWVTLVSSVNRCHAGTLLSCATDCLPKKEWLTPPMSEPHLWDRGMTAAFLEGGFTWL